MCACYIVKHVSNDLTAFELTPHWNVLFPSGNAILSSIMRSGINIEAFPRELRLDVYLTSQIYRQMYGELKLLPCIITLRFTKIQFWKKSFAIEFPYKHCNFWPLCLPVKIVMASKTVIRLIVYSEHQNRSRSPDPCTWRLLDSVSNPGSGPLQWTLSWVPLNFAIEMYQDKRRSK